MKIIFSSVFCLLSSVLLSQNLTQTIRGKIVDVTSKFELPGVQIFVFNDSSKVGGVQSDANGIYKIQNVPIGRGVVKANFLGYQSTTFRIEVTSAKEVILNFEMEESAVKVEEVVVTASKKGEVRNEMASVSARTFTVEETNRYAGSRSDPARMASNFAGVQGTDDSRNDIIIRGNSPLGILWRLDGVDIPNPNHFAIAGSTGGPVNIINNKTLENSEFYTGAFPAEYGNGNAGVFDLRMRNGNNEKHEFTGQFGFLGTELAVEGPISKLSGSSYLFSYRYSTLKLFDALNIRIGTSAVPLYQDGAFKFNFPGQKGSNFSIFGVGGKSSIDILVSTQTKPTEEIYGKKDRDQYFGSSMGVIGASYTKSLNEKTFVKFVAAHSGNESHSFHQMVFRDSTYTIDSMPPKSGYRYIDQKTSLNFFVNHKFSSKASMKTGLFFSYYYFDLLDSNRNDATYSFEQRNFYESSTAFWQPYVQFRIKTSNKLIFNVGLHAQYFALNGSSSIEPRAGMKWNIKENQSLSFGVGMHSQMQPTYIYFSHLIDSNRKYVWHNRNLGFTRSIHNVLSYDLAVSKNLRVKAEAYYQYLYETPVDIYPSSFSLLNQGSGFDRFFPDTLTNNGTGKNIGAELTIEKFFSKDFFFMITASVFDSKYKGSDGVERNTDFNGNFAVNGLLSKEFKIGKNKNSVLTTGTKITYAGGRRYTPADTAASAIAGELIGVDSLRNTKQFKNYFRWDIKIGFRANRKKVTHEFGLDIVNMLNTKNILSVTYIPNTKDPTEVIREDYQLGFLPLFYYKIDF
ncbi:MAG: TonB-dependent receptor [Bacteroidota bacterium]